jgi:hypothetical protein
VRGVRDGRKAQTIHNFDAGNQTLAHKINKIK